MTHGHTPYITPSFAEGVITVRNITIKESHFAVPSRYDVGHVLDVTTANALNNALADAIRGSFTNQLKKLNEAKASEAEIHSAFAKIISTFSFANRATRGSIDREEAAVSSLALRLAVAMVRQLLAKKGVKVRTVPVEKLNDLGAQLLARKPKLREEAQRQYDEKQALAGETFDADLDLAA